MEEQMNSKFNNVAIKGFVSVFPENKINIDDERLTDDVGGIMP